MYQYVIFHRFTCGRWLGKGIDDGSIERLLVAELLSKDVDTEGKITDIIINSPIKAPITTKRRERSGSVVECLT